MFGFLIVLLAAVSFCFQNVTVRVLFTEQPILGLFRTGGFVTPTLHHDWIYKSRLNGGTGLVPASGDPRNGAITGRGDRHAQRCTPRPGAPSSVFRSGL
ncbi:MAG: hypothetical protein SFW36_19705 [Leptolyngbyaceae cyanobacterium bins.59]|nr:hypothetical protein [Leptolyngbyaceae cyanobacterium bins.59]